MSNRLVSVFAVAGLALASCWFVGCGKSMPQTASLAGTVTIQGRPIPATAIASISFRPTGQDQAAAAASIISEGRYQCENVPIGTVLVVFDIRKPIGPVKASERTKVQYQEEVSLVPEDRAAGLSLKVNGNKADQDFDL